MNTHKTKNIKQLVLFFKFFFAVRFPIGFIEQNEAGLVKVHMDIGKFLSEDLETRAELLLAEGNFIALRKHRDNTCALYELYGSYVEVIVCNKVIKQIGFVNDTNRLATYVKKQAVSNFFRQ